MTGSSWAWTVRDKVSIAFYPADGWWLPSTIRAGVGLSNCIQRRVSTFGILAIEVFSARPSCRRIGMDQIHHMGGNFQMIGGHRRALQVVI